MAKHIVYIFLILNIFFKITRSINLSGFIIDYFISQKIQAVNILICNQSDGVSVHMNFQKLKAPFLSFVHALEFENNNYIAENIMNTGYFNSLGVFIDFSCESLNSLMEEVLNRLATNCCYNVLLWNKMSTNMTFIDDSIPYGTRLILARPNDESIILYDITDKRTITTLGNWENRQLFMENSHINKQNFLNQTLHGIISFTDQNIKNNSIVKFMNEEIFYLEMNSLSNFSLRIHRCLRQMYGLQWELTTISNPNMVMNLTNVFLNVSTDSFDFIITSENLLKTMSEEIITLPSIKTIRQCFVFRQPPVYSYKTFYLKPFSLGLWISLGIFLILSSILLYLMCLINIEDIDHNELSIFGNMLYCLGALINQGLSVSSKRSSKRLIHFNILQLSLFISNFYSAIILNYLLYPRHSTINGINDIINQEFDIGYEDTLYNNNSISANNSEITQYGIKNMIASYNITTGIEKMRTTKFAFLSIESNIHKEISEFLTDTEICELSSIHLKKTNELSMYLRKNSPYKEYFQKGLLLLKETGIINYEDKKWNKRNQECLGLVEYVEIGLKETSIALEIFIFGFLCSSFIFMLELIIEKFMSWSIIQAKLN